MRVYIAGPMSKGLWENNTRQAVDAAAILLKNDFEPFIPHLYTLVSLVHGDIHYERWMAMDFAYIRVCDAVLRLSGESAGADREVTYAGTRNIPVFTNLADLFTWRDQQQATVRELAADIQRVESPKV